MTVDPWKAARMVEGMPHRTERERMTRARVFTRLLLPDELFGEVMQGMVDSHWLRERAETIAAQGGSDANSKAAALFEAADAAETISGSPDAAP